jgi:hypothetical protein
MEKLGERLRAMRGPDERPPEMSVVVPVNAQGDLENVIRLLSDVAGYEGPHSAEVILVLNNFPPEEPPPEVDDLRRLGVTVLAIPSVRRPGEAVGFSARIPGIRAASAGYAILFDADCRLPHPTPLLNWYVEQFGRGAHAAYTSVSYYDYQDAPSIRFALAVHHAARWVKRNLLRIPTTRGSNYAVRCETMLELYEQGFLADEMNVGPTVKRLKGPVIYGSGKQLTVYTSGRMFRPGWRRKIRYFAYRLRYNMRVLPVRPGVSQMTGREKDPVRRYRNNRPVRDEGATGVS